MARRKKDSGGAALFFIIAAIVIAALVIATPIAILYLLIKNSLKLSKMKSIINRHGTSAFWLDDAEKTEFARLHNEVYQAQVAIKNAKIEAESANISKNADGQYSVRSKRGKEIREKIDRNSAVLRSSLYEYEELKELPRNRWQHFADALAMRNAAMVALVAWATGLVFYVREFSNDAIEGIKRFFLFALNFKDHKLLPDEMWWVLGITAGTIVVGLAAKKISEKLAGSAVEMPPLVDTSNYKVGYGL